MKKVKYYLEEVKDIANDNIKSYIEANKEMWEVYTDQRILLVKSKQNDLIVGQNYNITREEIVYDDKPIKSYGASVESIRETTEPREIKNMNLVRKIISSNSDNTYVFVSSSAIIYNDRIDKIIARDEMEQQRNTINKITGCISEIKMIANNNFVTKVSKGDFSSTIEPSPKGIKMKFDKDNKRK